MLAPTASCSTRHPHRLRRRLVGCRARWRGLRRRRGLRSLSFGTERDDAVEESESSEGDDFGLRVLVGRRQAVVPTNDLTGDVRALAERAVAMARSADDQYAGLADEALLAQIS